jgi:hypothetical protein
MEPAMDIKLTLRTNMLIEAEIFKDIIIFMGFDNISKVLFGNT